MSKNEYPIKISPLTPQKLESLHGRGEEVLFWQGELINEHWRNCAFSHCRFEDIKFFGNLMQSMSFFACVLVNLSFERSGLSAISFNNSILDNINFKGCDLSGVNFYKAHLKDCDFTGSEVAGLNLEGATLINCDFSKVDLREVNLFAAQSLQGSTYNHQTQLPFSKKEATRLGMVYLPNHLQVVKEDYEPTPVAQVINFPASKTITPSQKPAGVGEVINLVDYFKTKAVGDDDGPKLA